MKDLKYLASFIIPLLVVLGLLLNGVFTYLGVGFAFVIIPLLEPLFPSSKENLPKEISTQKESKKIFDYLLYLNLPLIYGIILLFLFWLNTGGYSTFELIGAILSVGTVLGANGINVAHELGHRFNKTENILAQALLLPSFYMHFFIEHNLGHHKHVATPEDPASARLNEMIYVFWIRSVLTSYTGAWKLESDRLNRLGKAVIGIHNRMIRFSFIQLAYILFLFSQTSIFSVIMIILAGIVGFLLLETINYIEHYGLLRKKLKNGRYERVRPKHSWNSNHELGRIVLYELTRHSDHHFISSKKFQVLDHHEDSPQLPFGYPTSMLLSLIPPLWFKLMNNRVTKFQA